jgi:hypothetical protein
LVPTPILFEVVLDKLALIGSDASVKKDLAGA